MKEKNNNSNVCIKLMILTVTALLIGTIFIPGTYSIKTSYDINPKSTSSDFFQPKMTIPKYCFNLSKTATTYEINGEQFKGEFNFPIGTFGNNFISYGPHGIDRIALYNNFFDSLGGSFGTGSINPQCLDGTFLGVFMKQDDKKTTRLLQQYSPEERSAKDYGLQPVDNMRCYSNIPIGYYQYKDTDLPAEIGAIVYSPLILNDIKNSSLPTSIWVFNAYNPTDKPIEVSFLFSLENDIGWRQNVADDQSWQRDGTYNYYWEDDNLAGIRYTYDKDMATSSHPEYLGDMTLATQRQKNVTVSYISEWNTKGDGNDLLSDFSQSGLLSNQNNSKRAVEGKKIYAGALSTKIVLQPGEGKNIPFVLSTCFPTFNLSRSRSMPEKSYYKWNWTNYFNESGSIAKYSMENHKLWWEEIQDWQEKLYNSGLPPDVITYMIGGISSYACNVFFTKDNYWFAFSWGLEGASNKNADWFLGMFYPEANRYSALEYCEAIDHYDGFCPGELWNRTFMLNQELFFVTRSYRAWMWNQDDEFLQKIYPSCKKTMEHKINREGLFQSYVDKEDGLIHNLGNDIYNDMWAMPLGSSLNSMWLQALSCMVSMAEHLNYNNDSIYFRNLFEKAQNSFIDIFWHKSKTHEYFKTCGKKMGWWGWWFYPDDIDPFGFPIPVYIRDSTACWTDQIYGTWHAKLVDKDILPIGKTKTALKSIYEINRDYHNNLGWITSVMGNPPYFIDNFGKYLFNIPNRICTPNQWILAGSLLSHGLIKEGLDVANVTVENRLYKDGGVYVQYKEANPIHGTNKINKIGLGPKDKIKGVFTNLLNKLGLIAIDEDFLGPPYPERPAMILPCWSLYQAAAGFTPCVGGLKIKPRIGGDNVVYISQFAGCKIEMYVNGTGDFIESAEIDGKPYNVFIDGSVYIPTEDFKNSEEMLIQINLS